MSDRPPSYTDPKQAVDSELLRWSRVYSGEEYFYGDEPGPVARRAVRYHRGYTPLGGTALDAGCGEGQDLAFLAERGYRATGIDFTAEGVEKSRRLLRERGLEAEVFRQDLRGLDTSRRYDLVLAVNAVQFMGADAPACLDRLMEVTAPGGVLGLSLFGREAAEPELSGTVWFTTYEALMARFAEWQRLETAKLWQWDVRTDTPQAFVTLVARKAPPSGRRVVPLR